MPEAINIAAFGALNYGSYEMFTEWAESCAEESNISINIAVAGPYPNEQAIDEPSRPLRGSALKNPALKEELFSAVASDARNLGENFDVYCMPCLSMVGFHHGVEEALGKSIIRLDQALKDYYQNIDKVGVIYMRPAQKVIEAIFGDKAIAPSEERVQQLIAAEEKAKVEDSAAPVETVMIDIVEDFKGQGLSHVLFARADAPKAQKHLADKIKGIQVDSYFQILAGTIVNSKANLLMKRPAFLLMGKMSFLHLCVIAILIFISKI